MGKQQRRDKIARLISWGHWFTFINILLCLAIGTLYIDAAEPPGSVLGVIYLLVSWIGHFAFVPFVFFIIVIFPFCLIVPYAHVLRGIAALVSSLGLVALIADALFYRAYGYHLNTYSLPQLASDAEAAFAGGSFVVILGVLLSFVVLLAFQVLAANVIWKRLDLIHQKRIGAPVTSVFVLCFLVSHSVHIWADGVFYSPITKQDDLFPLSYPTTAKTLLARHGLIDQQGIEARQELSQAADRIVLNYPTKPLMCAKNPSTEARLLVVFDRLPATAIEEVARSQELTAAPLTLLGHNDVAHGSFQMLYSMADIYRSAVAATTEKPAYLDTLTDFGISYSLETSEQFSQRWVPVNLLSDVTSLRDLNPNTEFTLQLRTWETSSMAELEQLLEQAQALNVHVAITALQPEQPSASIHPEALSVPLYTRGDWSLQQQPLANLSDIMPTLLGHYFNCSNGFENFMQGRDLSNDQESYPQLVSYAPLFVIYDEKQTALIERNGDMSVVDSESFKAMPNAEIPTPVLIDAMNDLKRFSGNRR